MPRERFVGGTAAAYNLIHKWERPDNFYFIQGRSHATRRMGAAIAAVSPPTNAFAKFPTDSTIDDAIDCTGADRLAGVLWGAS
jgi:hypothetical protein